MKKFFCNRCERTLQDSGSRQAEHLLFCKGTKAARLVCEYCERKFSTPNGTKVHIRDRCKKAPGKVVLTKVNGTTTVMKGQAQPSSSTTTTNVRRPVFSWSPQSILQRHSKQSDLIPKTIDMDMDTNEEELPLKFCSFTSQVLSPAEEDPAKAQFVTSASSYTARAKNATNHLAEKSVNESKDKPVVSALKIKLAKRNIVIEHGTTTVKQDQAHSSSSTVSQLQSSSEQKTIDMETELIEGDHELPVHNSWAAMAGKWPTNQPLIVSSLQRPVASVSVTEDDWMAMMKQARARQIAAGYNNDDLKLEPEKIIINKISCIQCSAVFFRRNSLRRHITRVHEKNNSITCEKCGIMCSSNKSYTRHCKEMHWTLDDFISYKKCKLCRRQFTSITVAAHEMKCKKLNESYKKIRKELRVQLL